MRSRRSQAKGRAHRTRWCSENLGLQLKAAVGMDIIFFKTAGAFLLKMNGSAMSLVTRDALVADGE